MFGKLRIIPQTGPLPFPVLVGRDAGGLTQDRESGAKQHCRLHTQPGSRATTRLPCRGETPC
jgi:hypothetical protein